MNDLKNLLNNEQYLSVTKIDGPSLILAGAGSGKTRVITYKIIHLIENGVLPENILAVTFTNRAAREMKTRVSELLRKGKKSVLLTTFHSLGLMILKEHITKLGYKSKFSIYDERDCQKLFKEILHELKLPEEEYDPYNLTFKISLIKMNLQTKIEDKNINDIYNKYQEYLKLYNAVDFDDLIKLPIEIFEKFPEILSKYQKKWKYILVDEYQDTSFMQYKIMKMLAEKHKNISIVGDDDQSIYSWRGANSNNLTLFEKDFYPIYEIRLEQNYRSTGNILKAANSIIKFNSNRKSKNLWTNDNDGDKIGFYEAQNEDDEADYVLTLINKFHDEGYEYKDFGILFRMNSLSRPFEEKLRENNIPYKVVGGMKFFDRPEIRDILSYMRFIANTNDEVALHRIINTPKRGIGNTSIHTIMEFSKENNAGLYATIKNFVSSNFLGKQTPYLEEFYKLIEKYRELVFKPKNISRSITSLVDEIDYKAKLISEMKDLKKIGYRMNNINQLVQSISRYENNPDNFEPNIFDYLQRISLATKEDDNDDKENQVNMMSIHSAKGLEFKIVFVVGVEDGLLPHFKTLEETGSDEEERRLFYVSVTRAREKLFLSYPKTRMKFNDTLYKQKSSFFDEIPKDLIEEINLEEKLATSISYEDLLKKWND